MTTLLASAEASEDLRRRAMRLSYHMPSVDVDETVKIIFAADRDHAGQFTELQFTELSAITDKAARMAKAYREKAP